MFMDSLAAAKSSFLEDFQKRLVEEEPTAGWKSSGRKTKALPDGEDAQFWMLKGPELVEGYAKWRDKNLHLQPWTAPNGQPGIELAFNIPVPGTEVMLRGYVDRVFQDTNNGTLMIVDLKSGARSQTSDLQLHFYRIGLRHALGVDIAYGSYYNARKGELDEISELNQFPEERVFRWVRNMISTIDKNLLIPSVGMSCSWCGVKDFCPQWNDTMPDFDSYNDLFDSAK